MLPTPARIGRPSPRFLDGAAPRGRPRLAEWLTDGRNPYFARNAVNVLWVAFFGTSLADSLDDRKRYLAIQNCWTNWRRRFARHDFDLKYLIRAITLSRAYQLSSAGPADAAEPRVCSRGRRCGRCRATALRQPADGDRSGRGSAGRAGRLRQAGCAAAQAFLAFFARGDGTGRIAVHHPASAADDERPADGRGRGPGATAAR